MIRDVVKKSQIRIKLAVFQANHALAVCRDIIFVRDDDDRLPFAMQIDEGLRWLRSAERTGDDVWRSLGFTGIPCLGHNVVPCTPGELGAEGNPSIPPTFTFAG